MTLNFASFIRTIKPYANNINISDEEFVTNLFDYIGPELHIVNSRNGEPLYLSKARISLLLNQKEDVSDNIRAPFCRTKAKDILTKILPDYLEDNMNPSRRDALMDSVRNLLLSDSSLDEMARKTYSSLNDMELFAVVFIEAIKANNQLCPIEKELWHSGNSSISIMSGNIISLAFNNKNDDRKIVVVPVNTAFDTQISSNSEDDIFPLVSETTIHGQWLKKIIPLIGKEDLDNRIQNYLIKSGAEPNSSIREICGGKSIKYPVGTTAVIQHRKVIFYLLAVSDFDERNVARSSKEWILAAINELIDFYDQRGLGYSLYMPLIGTGKSRAHLSTKESLRLIMESLIQNEKRINGNVTIVVLEKMMSELI